MDSAKNHFNKIAWQYDNYKKKNWYYYQELKKLLKNLIPERKKILEIGCGTGDILCSLNPTTGKGIDISSEMIKAARLKYKRNRSLLFQAEVVERLKPKMSWDYIVMVDVIEHLDNIESTLRATSRQMSSQTNLIITMANPFWEPALMLAEKLKLKMPEGPHSRISYNNLQNLLQKSGLKTRMHGFHLLLPIYIPVLTNIINSHFYRLFERYAFIEYIVARKD